MFLVFFCCNENRALHLGAKGHALYVPGPDSRFLKQLPCGGAKRRPPLLRILLGAAVGRDIEPVRGRSARYKLNLRGNLKQAGFYVAGSEIINDDINVFILMSARRSVHLRSAAEDGQLFFCAPFSNHFAVYLKSIGYRPISAKITRV